MANPFYSETAFICMIIHLLILFRILLSKEMRKNQSHLIFLTASSLAFSFMEMFWCFAALGYYTQQGFFVIASVHTVMTGVVSYAWLIYTLKLHNSDFIGKRFRVFIILIPIVIIALLTVINPFTGILFTINPDFSYNRGVLYPVTAVFTYGYFVFALIDTVFRIFRGKKENRRRCLSILYFSGLPLIMGILQLCFPYKPYLSIGFTLGIVSIFINVITKDYEAKLEKDKEDEVSLLEKTLGITVDAYREIYQVDLRRSLCRSVYPVLETVEQYKDYKETIDNHFRTGKILRLGEEEIRQFLSEENITAGLKMKDKLEYRYQRYSPEGTVEWCLVTIIAQKWSNDEPVDVILTIRSIEELTKNEVMQQRELQRSLERQEAISEFAIRKEHQFKLAIISHAISFFEFNISRNFIIDRVTQIVDGEELSVLKAFGLEENCNYDQYISRWHEKMVVTEKEEFIEKFSIDNLKACYKKGKKEISLTFWTTDVIDRLLYVRLTVMISKDEITGDIIGFAYINDITEETKQREDDKLLIKALESTLVAYRAVYYIRFDEDKCRMLYPELQDREAVQGNRYTFQNSIENKVIHPDDAVIIEGFFDYDNIKRLMTGRDRIDVRYRRATNDGQYEWCMLTITVFEYDGEEPVSGIMTVRSIQDIVSKDEEQKAALSVALDKAEAATRAKSTFLSNMSHDIRTPMNAIIGFTGMAKKYIGTDTKRAEECLDKLDVSSQHMLHILNDVLDMARIESGKVQLSFVDVNLKDNCEAIDTMFRSSMENKDIAFSTSCNVTDSTVSVDSVRLNQIIANLVSNALKYTPEGGEVSLSYNQTGRTEDGKAIISIAVKDNGIGMSEEYQTHLFEAFERERSSTVSGIQGTGLGLAIVKRLVELMNGSISCTSKLGEGTEFRLQFEFAVSDVKTDNGASSSEPVSFIGKRILLVEDNELNREIATEILTEIGFEVEAADDGTVAVEAVKNKGATHYDIILMDIQMPQMDGYRATEIIRSLPVDKAADIPIIAMTANAFEEDKRKSREAGMNGHLAKPIDVAALIGTLSGFFPK